MWQRAQKLNSPSAERAAGAALQGADVGQGRTTTCAQHHSRVVMRKDTTATAAKIPGLARTSQSGWHPDDCTALGQAASAQQRRTLLTMAEAECMPPEMQLQSDVCLRGVCVVERDERRADGPGGGSTHVVGLQLSSSPGALSCLAEQCRLATAFTSKYGTGS